MAKHHGMTSLQGLHAFCHIGTPERASNRFGRMINLPPLFTAADRLRALGAPGGPMDGGTTSDRTATVDVGQVFFGQFVDHDITLDTTTSLAEVAGDDVPNVRTPTLDLECIYGDGPEASPYLYHGEGDYRGVKLMTGADGTAVSQPPALAADDLCRTAHGTAIIGDPRNDENRIISQLQLAMIRFHNNVAQHLHDTEGLEGGELFEHAREVATWHYQWVVINDFLVHTCGAAVVDDVLGRGRRFYCANNGQPYIPVEFSVAAYRFGHSMIPQNIQIQQGDSARALFGTVLGAGFRPLENANGVVDWNELVETSAGQTVQRAEKLDSKMASILLALPFIPAGSERSLASRNLLRGQTFRLPSGEAVAEYLGRPATEIEQVSDKAQDLAGSIDLSAGTPLWFYLLVEAEQIGRETTPGDTDNGEGLGPSGARIVAETLIGLVELDTRSFLASNRNWTPADGVGVSTLGEMLTYTP